MQQPPSFLATPLPWCRDNYIFARKWERLHCLLHLRVQHGFCRSDDAYLPCCTVEGCEELQPQFRKRAWNAPMVTRDVQAALLFWDGRAHQWSRAQGAQHSCTPCYPATLRLSHWTQSKTEAVQPLDTEQV